MAKEPEDKSMESWIWDAACSIHGAVDAPKYKDFILPLIFVKRLCDVFDDEINRIASEVGSREKAFKLVEHDKKLVRFYIPLKSKNAEEPVWTAIRKLTAKIGETLTTHLRAVAKENPLLSGIIDRVDFNATTHGVRDIDDDRLSNLIEEVSKKRLGLNDVEPDIIGRSYEYLIRKFAEGGGQSAGEFYTPKEVGMIMAKIMDPVPGMTIYDPCCGSAGLLIKCELALDEKMKAQGRKKFSGLTLYGQEYIAQTWAMANMNMIIHDMEGQIEIGDTFRNPKFRDNNRLMTFDRVVANPMWNQTMFGEKDYDADAFGRFPNGAGYPGNKADWGWMQHIFASLNDKGKAAVVFDTGAASRGSGNANSNKEKEVRKNRLFLVNASKEFAKGDPKNYITEEGIEKIASAFLKWEEIEKFSRIVTKEEIVRNDYNISPSRYIHVSEAEEYRPVAEIVEELNALEDEAKATDLRLRTILARMGI